MENTINNSFDYAKYWEQRYKDWWNSWKWSYWENAEFKAAIINKFIEENNIISVTEFGCWDWNNLWLYNIKNYEWLDISKEAINKCKELYKSKSSHQFSVIDMNEIYKAEMTMALDVTYHIFPRSNWESFINKVIDSATEYAIFYSFLNPNWHAIHINDFNFIEYIEQLSKEKWFSYEVLDLVPPDSQSRFVIIKK